MRKFHLAFFALIFLALGVDAQVLSFTYTPNGTYVPGSPWGEMSSWDCSNAASTMASSYPSAGVVRRPTRRYNCHGFAWHMSNSGSSTITQKIWINAPNPTKYQTSAYGGDNSYGVSSETSGAKAHYFAGDHSANVFSGGSYRSKWGQLACVNHTRYYVPTSYQPNSVRWFRRQGSGFNNAELLDMNTEIDAQGNRTLDWFVDGEMSGVYAFKIVRKVGDALEMVGQVEIPRKDLANVGPEGEHYVVEVPANEKGELYLQLLGAAEGDNLFKF
jgi:hypothetical protein